MSLDGRLMRRQESMNWRTSAFIDIDFSVRLDQLEEVCVAMLDHIEYLEAENELSVRRGDVHEAITGLVGDALDAPTQEDAVGLFSTLAQRYEET